MNYNIIRPPLHKNFELPSRDELLDIHSGKLVKIIFQVGSEEKGGKGGKGDSHH